jgi:hypothetical protein
MIAVLLAGAAESQAAYNVTISGSGSSNGSCSGGPPDVRTPSGTGSNVSVADIQTRLATMGVTFTTADVQLKTVGPITDKEKIAMATIIFSIIGFASEHWHHINKA